MIFEVDGINLKGPGQYFYVDDIYPNNTSHITVRKVIKEHHNWRTYSMSFESVLTLKYLKNKDDGGMLNLTEGELAWLEKVNIFIESFSFEVDVSVE